MFNLFERREITHLQKQDDPENAGCTLTTRVEHVTPGMLSGGSERDEVVVERHTPPRLSNLFLGDVSEVSRKQK